MRVTSYTILQRWFDDNQSRLADIDLYNRQVSTGKKVERPSDDPTGANRIIQINEVVRRNDKYLSNIEEAIHMNATTESVMDSVFNRLIRVKGLAIESSNDASMAQTGVDEAFMEELRGIKDSLIDLAMTKVEGKFIFNGTAGDTPPYSAANGGPYTGDTNMLRINLGQGQSVTLNLTGDRAFRETEIRSGIRLFGPSAAPPAIDPLDPPKFMISDGLGFEAEVTVTDLNTLVADLNQLFTDNGANLVAGESDGYLTIKIANSESGGEITVTQTGGDIKTYLGLTSGTKNMFAMIDDLINTMETKSVSGVAGFLDRIDRLSENVANQRGQYGSRARNLEFARDRIEQYNLTSATLKENIEGADAAKAIMKLSSGEQAYQASLAAGARIFNISILDFLR